MSITAVTAPGLVHLFAFGGHYSAAFTLDRYGHVTETMRQESVGGKLILPSRLKKMELHQLAINLQLSCKLVASWTASFSCSLLEMDQQTILQRLYCHGNKLDSHCVIP